MILDTNVISELARVKPDAKVLAWLLGQAPSRLSTTTICVAEITAGIALLPAGARRDQVEARMKLGLQPLAARIFSFDQAAARHYGEIVAKRQILGRPLRGFDGLIVAIAFSRRLALVTRNIRDFSDCGVELFNPWE